MSRPGPAGRLQKMNMSREAIPPEAQKENMSRPSPAGRPKKEHVTGGQPARARPGLLAKWWKSDSRPGREVKKVTKVVISQ